MNRSMTSAVKSVIGVLMELPVLSDYPHPFIAYHQSPVYEQSIQGKVGVEKMNKGFGAHLKVILLKYFKIQFYGDCKEKKNL